MNSYRKIALVGANRRGRVNERVRRVVKGIAGRVHETARKMWREILPFFAANGTLILPLKAAP